MGTAQLQEQSVRIQRTLIGCLILVLSAGVSACTTLPTPVVKKYTFPKEAYVDEVTRPYETLGTVRAQVNFNTLDPAHDEEALCRNYYNQAVRDLVKMAKEKNADAVIDVRSVVFYEGSQPETHKTPECSDDGGEGQILAQGQAIKWKKE